jgi:hypothetical protein
VQLWHYLVCGLAAIVVAAVVVNLLHVVGIHSVYEAHVGRVGDQPIVKYQDNGFFFLAVGAALVAGFWLRWHHLSKPVNERQEIEEQTKRILDAMRAADEYKKYGEMSRKGWNTD